MLLHLVRMKSLNMSEAIKFKRKMSDNFNLNSKMLDTAEDGYVLIIERKTVNDASYKLLAEFAIQNKLNLQLEIGNYILSTNALAPTRQPRQVF
jgi:hypothetical protein